MAQREKSGLKRNDLIDTFLEFKQDKNYMEFERKYMSKGNKISINQKLPLFIFIAF